MRAVLAAIQRWEEKGLVASELAEELRIEVEEDAAGYGQQLFQYALAVTGAVILLIAGGVFLDWAWPLMTEGMRAAVLALVGLLVCFGGVGLEKRRRWVPVAYLLQAAGLGLVAIGLSYSERAWPDMSAGAVAGGVVGLAIPPLLGLRTLRRNSVMPAVHLAFGLLFVGLFLDRATPLVLESIIWVLDGILLVAIVGLARILATDPQGLKHPWALNAFAMSLYSGFVLVVMTGDTVLDLGEDAVYALDVWLLLVAALTVYGIHRAPEGLRRGWFAVQLSLCQLAWIPLGMISTIEVASGPPEAAFVAVGGSGIAGFLYARETGTREVLAASALSLIFAAWYWGVERAGALGAVLALTGVAALLFWFSGKTGAEPTADPGPSQHETP
jgi:hypothetical protein